MPVDGFVSAISMQAILASMHTDELLIFDGYGQLLRV